MVADTYLQRKLDLNIGYVSLSYLAEGDYRSEYDGQTDEELGLTDVTLAVHLGEQVLRPTAEF